MSESLTSRGQVLTKGRENLSELVDNWSSGITRSRGISRVTDLLLQPAVLLLILVGFVVSRGITRGEFFFYGDEMSHAMNGVFFRDFLVDLPLRHPIQYVYSYYAKYPALAFPHWPPLFHFLEGIFFLLFGLSPFVSRLTILCFSLMGVYFWYRIAERLGPRYRAFLSAVILACLPFVLLYERITMLEIPILAACLAVIHFWLKFRETERPSHLWILAGWTAAAFLISQKAIFLAFFIVFDVIIERRFRLLRRVDTWLAAIACVLAILPWYLVAAHTLSFMVGRAIPKRAHYLAITENYTFYLTRLYGQLGPVLIGLACVGLLLAVIRRSRSDRFLLLWVLAGYVCFVLIVEKDPRHTMLWIPPLIYLALLGLETLCVRQLFGVMACSVLALIFVVNGLRAPRPRVTGAEETAKFVYSLPESDVVYFQGELDGDFIFFARKLDAQKRRLVAREKQIVVTDVGRKPSTVLATTDEVLHFFKSWGIRYAAIDNVDDLPGLGAVRTLLNSDQFELIRTIPIESNVPRFHNREIQVFRFRGELQRTDQNVVIPMMTIHKDISVNLSSVTGHPWPN